jgi:hypothetical protein
VPSPFEQGNYGCREGGLKSFEQNDDFAIVIPVAPSDIFEEFLIGPGVKESDRKRALLDSIVAQSTVQYVIFEEPC